MVNGLPGVDFRVRRPPQDKSTAGIPNHVLSSRGYFFDNPRRYDSDDDLAWSIPPQNMSASLSSDCYDWSSRHSSFTVHTDGDEQRVTAAGGGELHPYP
uniref:integral membrane protein GPR137B-like n=1 Tax=Monopterus albus TaxID=43700 RepID=UPI0009B44AC4|nr:integral membrane protein GPR137B-like [Monopterus albus]